ncbi:disease resistance protein RGA2-like [Carex rostrata]
MAGVQLITGGWFASAVIGKVVDLGRSYLGDNYDLHTGTREMLTNLEIQLPHIQSVIETAEKQQITNKGLDTWLEQLKDAAYEAEDVLDHFEANRIRESIKGKCKVSEIASSSGKMVKNLFSPDKDLKDLKSVVKKLDKLCMGDFIKALQAYRDEGKEQLGNLGNETSSYLAPDVTIFGRDEEIKFILDMILNVLYGDFNHKPLDYPNLQQAKGEGSSSLSNKIFRNLLSWGIPGKEKLMSIRTVIKGDAPERSKNIVTTVAEPHSINNRKLAVIPIVGLGGVGKTTLAKIIYSHERVKEHFGLKAWVYVSKIHDAKKIMQDMLCSFKECGIEHESTTICSQNLNIVENRLIKTIRNQRLLLILDDLTDAERTKHIWSDLRSVLYYGEVGSVVVVTTQSPSIVNLVGTLPEVKLDVLKEDLFLKLFQYYAFDGFKFGNKPPLSPSAQQELQKIGKQIAEKLHGLPLAGKVIGTLLSSRLEKEFWEDICGSDWWNIEGAREQILPSIGVGFNYLKSELKQCFVFCSIFPKQYEFERERLVQMWIAQGFIQPSTIEKQRLERGDIRLEDIGRKWFGKLVDRIFFEPTISDGKYVMHDLVRDLAIAVSSNEFCFVKSNDKHLPSTARHLGIDCDNSEVEWKCENSTRIRTVILFGNWTNESDKFISNIFANYKGLRVLDSSYIVLETNDFINDAHLLWHLRFVDLSFTGIKSIPDEFCALCHLQVLDVRGCIFEKLPKGMNKLINLPHLYASSDTISLISSIGKLTKLQDLGEFRIGKCEGHKISELKGLNEISGHLLLSGLQNVSSKEEAAESKIDKKKYLKSLEFRFDYNDNGGSTTEVKMEILDTLKPAPSLEFLKVGGCSGETLPGWMCSSHPVFYNLKVIHVSHFQLRRLPPFGELPYLELLSIHNLPSIEEVGSEFYGSSDVIFPSLKELTFSLMSRWSNWEDGDDGKMIFPHLKNLHLKDCGSLKTLPPCSLTSVVELTLSECSYLHKIQTVQMPSLAYFSITTKVIIPIYIDCTLKSLEVLHLLDIDHICFVGGLKYLVKLRELVIKGCTKIQHTYEEYPLIVISQEEYEKQCLQSLTYLHLGCSLFGTRILPRLGRLPSLRTLLIEKYFSHFCNMKDQESWFNQLTSLEKLEFRNCKRLSCLPSELHLLTSLKKLHISSCPQLCSLPENGLPPNLVELYIEECPHLLHQCQPNQGEDWHKISHIPFIHFNEEIGTVPIQSP